MAADSSRPKLLLLGGTTEASALARLLAADGRLDATLSLAGATRAPRPQPIPTRIGGFGGAGGLAQHLRETGTRLLVDATHPFAARISANAAAAARLAGVTLLAVRRPPWVAGPGDCWVAVPDMQAAARALGPLPRRVLLTVGRKELAPFAAAPGHRYLVRSVDPPPEALLPRGATVITATGPFALEDERALLRAHGIEAIVTKNSGGTATAAKLGAARELGVTVVMVARPAAPPEVEAVATAEAAMRWVARMAPA
ncbi:cobalt-precorrin-6A reductase [Roseomonas sp. NAR14]|uniref:Cobalt-precorrin-6A reductase n=1 Tax=Roseomonas acroporae TaxID=2937791 RepID=A0A9X1YE93_9PROT|nr:cobalt-precorrin-6A reductase [Roseomonas acroporae]MCK8787445.1 cobalt-precorrin-6A reductase [Roseomonas acroporae]